jgi:hypothetical protein
MGKCFLLKKKKNKKKGTKVKIKDSYLDFLGKAWKVRKAPKKNLCFQKSFGITKLVFFKCRKPTLRQV